MLQTEGENLMAEWKPDPAAPDRIFHLGGVSWYDAPRPRRFHRCTPQTRGSLRDSIDVIERCACGALRYADDGVWMERNGKKAKG